MERGCVRKEERREEGRKEDGIRISILLGMIFISGERIGREGKRRGKSCVHERNEIFLIEKQVLFCLIYIYIYILHVLDKGEMAKQIKGGR